MTGAETEECVGIVERICLAILNSVESKRGVETSTLRRYVGYLHANAADLIQSGLLPEKIIEALNEARVLGAALIPFSIIRVTALAETPTTLVGTTLKYVIVQFALAQEARIAAAMTFRSVDDAAVVSDFMAAALDEAAERAADDLSTGTYLALIRLRGSISRHLSETARRLPRVLTYEWQITMPSLTMSQRIYRNGSRSDDLAQQNRVVHPAFMPKIVKALAI